MILLCVVQNRYTRLFYTVEAYEMLCANVKIESTGLQLFEFVSGMKKIQMLL